MNEPHEKRKITILAMHAEHITYTGDMFTVGPHGVVLYLEERTFVPWNRVVAISYSYDDRNLDARLFPDKYRGLGGI